MDDYAAWVVPLVEVQARYLWKKQRKMAPDGYELEDLEAAMLLCALDQKRAKYEPWMSEGEDGVKFVSRCVQNDGRDELKGQTKHKKACTPEDLEVGSPEKKRAERELGLGEGYLPLARDGVSKRENLPSPATKFLAHVDEVNERHVHEARKAELQAHTWAALAGSDELFRLDGDRDIFELYLFDYDERAIADALGRGVSTVYRRLAEIRKQLEQKLA